LGGGAHGGTAVDLNQPHCHVLPQHEVRPVQLERVLSVLNGVLAALHSVDYDILHGGVGSLIPYVAMPLSPEVLGEFIGGEHVVAGELLWPVLLVLKVMLHTLIGQVILRL